ncbi:MAG TPA: PAS domain S-box protein [Pirellulaceae bacterium]|nr:PAS domain S-box protein [Pirellulaceae bacterium]
MLSLALVLRWLLFALAFLGCAELGHFLSFPGQHRFAMFWPASGLFLAALAISPKRHWPGYIAMAIAVNVLSEWMLHGKGVTLVAAFVTANTLEAVGGATLLQLVHRRPFRAETVADTLWMVGLGALLAPLAGAAIGGAAVTEAFAARPFWYSAAVWWMAHAVGVLAVAPMLLMFPSEIPWKRVREPKVWLEGTATLLLVVLSSLVAFGPKLGFDRPLPAYPFVVAPFLIWCGLRLGQFGTAVGVFLAAVVAVWGTARGYGLFAHMEQTLETKSVALQVYLTVVTVTPLLFATAIQQQRMAESILRASEAKARAMFEMAADAIIWIDERGTIEAFNPAAERMFGYAAESILGQNIKRLMPAPYRDEHDDYLANYSRSGQRKILGAMREVAGLRSDGTQFALELTVSEVLQGNRRTFSGVVRDITERRLAQQSLEDAKDQLERRVVERTADLRQEMAERALAEERLREQQSQLARAARLSNLGEMAAELAHEVNQPLSAISNYVRGTQRRLTAGNVSIADIEPALEFIGKEANRAADIIRRTKDFVRQQFPPRVLLDLSAVVREALALVEHDLRDRQVQSQLILPDSLPRCLGDAIQLQQVVVNLVLNAADALQGVPADRRQITVTARGHDGCLELAVADSGPGIPPVAAERVFEAFFSTKPQGLGLGLPISRGIIEKHGGKLWVERELSGGACLRFTIPAWEESQDVGDVHKPDCVRGG